MTTHILYTDHRTRWRCRGTLWVTHCRCHIWWKRAYHKSIWFCSYMEKAHRPKYGWWRCWYHRYSIWDYRSYSRPQRRNYHGLSLKIILFWIIFFIYRWSILRNSYLDMPLAWIDWLSWNFLWVGAWGRLHLLRRIPWGRDFLIAWEKFLRRRV